MSKLEVFCLQLMEAVSCGYQQMDWGEHEERVLGMQYGDRIKTRISKRRMLSTL